MAMEMPELRGADAAQAAATVGRVDQGHIRNFCIIAHIDHGKSTLADRILQSTGTVAERDMRSQVLDSMDLERERGITIKAQAVRVHYTAADGETYQLNLIDTPGHVDFSYEVSRSLAACEGALLVVDASQGIEAQTLANTYLAIEDDLEIIPVLNKIDLPAADPELHGRAVADLIGDDPENVLRISAKTGEGVHGGAGGDRRARAAARGRPRRAGARPDLRLGLRPVPRRGGLRPGGRRRLRRRATGSRAMQTGLVVDAEEIGVMAPVMTPTGRLAAGETGYLVTGLKNLGDLRVGDTLTRGARSRPRSRCPATARSSRWCSAASSPSTPTTTPTCATPSRSSRSTTPRCAGSPRPRRRWASASAAASWACCTWTSCASAWSASTTWSCWPPPRTWSTRSPTTGGGRTPVRSPVDLPPPTSIEMIEEPYVRCTILVPKEGVGAVMDLCQDRRGRLRHMEPIENRQQIVYDLPLAEIVLDFYDQLKTRTRGYASLDYEIIGYRESPLVKLDILLAGDTVDALSMIVHRDQAYARGKGLVEQLHKTIPRQLFEVPIQAAIGGKILARETVKALRKDVLAKCYGGDISRKRKLLGAPEGGQEAHEAGGHGRGAPGGLPRRCCRSATTAAGNGK